MDLNTLTEILRNYGATGVLLLLFVYIVLRGRISFEYPRSRNKK